MEHLRLGRLNQLTGMVDVFISYSRTDIEAVTRLAEAVEAEGYNVWWDADLPPHLSYGDVITDKIGTAKAAIVVWSKDSAASQWVRAEADMARNQNKLVQTAIDNVMPPLPFNQIQFAELGNWRGEADHPGWRKVKASLTELVGRPADPAAPPLHRQPVRDPVAPPPAAAPSKWPLYAGIAFGVVALLVAAVLVMRSNREERAEATAEQIAQAQPTPTPAAAQGAAGPASSLDAPARPAAASQPVAVASAPAEPAASTPEAAGLTRGIEVLPFSSDRPLTPGDIAGMNKAQLWIARNEIFARHGRKFRDARLRQWFSAFSWYQPSSFEVVVSPLEQRNVTLLQRAEARFGG